MQQLEMFTEQLRSEVRPLDQADEIYAVLSRLPVGASVPKNIYISDYVDGIIPDWIVQEREVHLPILILTVVDSTTFQRDVMGEIYALAHEIFTCRDKTLSAPLYKWFPGCEKRRDMLTDIRQYARSMNDRGNGANDADDN